VSVLVGTRAIGDNQGVSLQDPFKLPPEQLAGDDGYPRARDDGRGPRFPRASRA
jgi:hypothetical protein